MRIQYHYEGECVIIEPGTIHRVICPIERHYGGDYRIEYDGKCITLYGKDTNYKETDKDGIVWHEEMILTPIVAEVRNASPTISKVDKNVIEITLNKLNVKQ